MLNHFAAFINQIGWPENKKKKKKSLRRLMKSKLIEIGRPRPQRDR